MMPLRLAAGIFVIAVMTAAAASAQNYPWCANFADGAGANCGFTSYQQCMATSMGSGGSCDKNNAYRGMRPQRRRAIQHAGTVRPELRDQEFLTKIFPIGNSRRISRNLRSGE